MKIVFFLVLAILAIVGVSYIVFEIYYRLTRLSDDDVCLVLFPKNNDEIDIEFSVRSMIAKADKLSVKNIICITDNLDDYNKKLISLLKKYYPYLRLSSKEDCIKKAGL